MQISCALVRRLSTLVTMPTTLATLCTTSILLFGFGCHGGATNPASPARSPATAPVASLPPPPPTPPPTVIVTRSDVRVLGVSIGITPEQLLADRTPVIGALHDAKVATPRGAGATELVVGYTPDASAAVVLAAWRATHEAGFTRVDLGSLVDGKAEPVCTGQRFAPPPTGAGTMQLSVRIDPSKLLMGLARAPESGPNDTPYAARQGRLMQEKQSAFDADSHDLEVAAPPETTGEQLTAVLEVLCRLFSDVQPLDVAELTAKPTEICCFDPNAPAVKLGPPTITGAIDQDAVVAALVANQPRLQYCYERQLLANAALAGSVDVTLAIRTNGTAPDAAATGVDPQMSACMAEVLQHVDFPAPRSGSPRSASSSKPYRPARYQSWKSERPNRDRNRGRVNAVAPPVVRNLVDRRTGR